LFGYTRRTVQEKLRVAEALEELPRLARALDAGSLSWSAARELSRVAVADTEQEWLEVARGKTLRQLEELVAGKRLRDEPSTASRPEATRHVLRFEVAAETLALFREALSALRRRGDGAWDDDSALLEMARHVLGGPQDDGRASYQIALAVCPSCGEGRQQASGELVRVPAEVVAMAQCDCQHLGCIASRAADENAMDTVLPTSAANENAGVNTAPSTSGAHLESSDPSGRVQVGADLPAENDSVRAHRGASVRTRVDGHHANVDVDTGIPMANVPASKRLSARPDLPMDNAPSGASVLTRAKQTIPPALRRAVLLRDQQRCRVPGCRNSLFLDVHHVELRSEGGRNEFANLVTLCGAHHRAGHRGHLVIEPDAHVGGRFRHADGTEYGQALQPQALDIFAKLFSALRGLGFREREIQVVLAELRRDDGLRGASIEALLREGLRRIQLPNLRR
jgi:hypothetical protein